MIMVVIVTLLIFYFVWLSGNGYSRFYLSRTVETYMPHLKAGSVYLLNKFYGSRSKDQSSVADHSVTISLALNFVLSVL